VAIFSIKQGDNSRYLRVTLSTDLTGAAIQFRMANAVGDIVINKAATLVTPSVVIDGITSGVVEYQWQTGDTALPGRYKAEFIVTFSGGAKETFPADGYVDVIIFDAIELEEATTTFTLNTTGTEKLCSDQMIRDLMSEVDEFPDSVYDGPNKLAELKLYAKEWLEFKTKKSIIFRDIVNELHDGNQKFFISVKRPPIISVTTVTIADEVKVAGTDYWVYPDHIMLVAVTPRGHQNVKVSYRSGIGSTVSTFTALTIARVAALFITADISSGPSEASSIKAGPVALTERVSEGGRYNSKTEKMMDAVNEWIRSKKGVRMGVVGHQLFPKALSKVYNPRKDAWE
jgi:hypothetical protein